MKKVMGLLLVAVMASSLPLCGGKNNKKKSWQRDCVVAYEDEGKRVYYTPDYLKKRQP